jgi:hypothetical protein
MNYGKLQVTYSGYLRQINRALGFKTKPWHGYVLYWSEDNIYDIHQILHVQLDDILDRDGLGFLSIAQIKK